MASISKVGRTGSRGEPEKTRAAILKSALEEFAQEGVTGARTDEIARRAGVNKALLYYYFKDKEGLYAAALEQVFTGLHERVMPVLNNHALPPRERLLKYVATHFDYIAGSPLYPRLVQREFMRVTGKTLSPVAGRILERYGKPLYTKLATLVSDGIESGDFRKVDPWQTVTSIIGIITFYFISLPAQQVLLPGDPVSAERVAGRRAAVLDFLTAAICVPRSAPHGEREKR
ncbi:MAG TPA: TetR/AcrR family transcriptional regulator [Candidatus Angelobacter sp.]|jgi:TetR/AcrR family transcriptional regulator|nr:TetR/AcrR family transcriptional regulator [Candidatus Angelobacter sp.]